MQLLRDLLGIFLLSCTVAPILGSCASAPVPTQPLPGQPESHWELTSADLSTKRLFRVSYSGDQGRGSFRIAMILRASSSYSLSASDTFGRAIWDLIIEGGDSYLVDHKRSRVCSIDTLMALPEDTLETFPLESLPKVLLGRFPVAPTSESPIQGQAADFLDQEGRRWTAKLDDTSISTWTLWSEGEPWIWWTRQPRGGILSHRRGSQIRWKEAVVEPLRDSNSRIEIPASYEQVECDESDLPELRQDQTPSSGSSSR